MGQCSSKNSTQVHQSDSYMHRSSIVRSNEYAEFHNDKTIPKKRSRLTEPYHYQ